MNDIFSLIWEFFMADLTEMLKWLVVDFIVSSFRFGSNDSMAHLTFLMCRICDHLSWIIEADSGDMYFHVGVKSSNLIEDVATD